MEKMNILVTGGAGYIGSHSCVELVSAGYTPIVFDNMSNANPIVMDRLAELTGRDIVLVKGDVRDQDLVEHTLRAHECQGVIHFAGLKSVGESVADPLLYYSNNVFGTINLLKAMKACAVNKIIFSSSACVYGDPRIVPIPESHAFNPENPYGQTKAMVEHILGDVFRSDPDWAIAILRYFNPVGAHPSGRIGEDPNGVPNNLMPFIAQVAIGRREKLDIFGGDYDTPDGTGVRDYIHVVDLARGHVAALKTLDHPHCTAINLGSGVGISVLEMVTAFEAACGKPIARNIAPRRAGDVGSYYGDPSLARDIMGWSTELGIARMCEDTWRWQQNSPKGYAA